MKLNELLNFFDFDYKRYPDGYGLVDMTGANLAMIEDERFSNPISLVIRLVEGIYGDDYLYSDSRIEGAGCDSVEEYIEKYANNKDYNEQLYYCHHLDELEDLPPILHDIDEIYNKAREEVEEKIENDLKASNYSCYEILKSDVETPHTLEVLWFETKDDRDNWINGRNLSNIQHYFQIKSQKYYIEFPELNEHEIEETEELEP